MRIAQHAAALLSVASAAAFHVPKHPGLRHSRVAIVAAACSVRRGGRLVLCCVAAMTSGARTALDEVDSAGNFARTAAAWTGCTVERGGRFEPEAGRYHLYVALGCPWANGALTALYHKGLEGVISYSVVHPTWARTRPDDADDTHCGWHFKAPGDEPVPNALGHGANECDSALVPDTVNGFKTLREVYELAGDEGGKYSTPVLFCKKERTIVSNESMDILKILNSSFNELALHPEVDLFPAHLQEATEKLNALIYPSVNNGVYRCGFAQSQGAHDTALAELFAALDELEKTLGASKFLTGNAFTWLDLRLYHTLVRFDSVYHTYFKTNLRRIQDYPALLRFLRAAYAVPAVKRTTNMRHIKMHYFTSHPHLNPFGIIPGGQGPALEIARADCLE